MYALLLSVALCKPAYFEINVQTNTVVTMFIDGQKIEAGQEYKVEAFIGSKTVEVEVRYIDGMDVCTSHFEIELEAGYKKYFRIRLIANPPIAKWCQSLTVPKEVS